jgi:predicted nucleotidyltransferase
MDNKLKIINYLGKAFDQEFTMHELSKILKIPYASFYRTIEEIGELLIIRRIGKSKTLRLNLKNPVIKSYLSIASQEEKRNYLTFKPIIKLIHNDLNTKETVILFGSYAKNKERENSDIDLIIINKSGKKTISFSRYETLYKKEINPMFFKNQEIKYLLKDNEENVFKQALRNHIILANPEEFWRIVINGLRER